MARAEDHHVRIRVTQCGICTSEIDLWSGKAPEKLPAAIGHEVAGIVAELPTNPLIQTPDVARLAGVSVSAVRLWEQTGRLPAIRTVGGMRLFARAWSNVY